MRALVSQRMVRVFECIRMRSQVPRMRILCASARVVPALGCQPAYSASLALDGVASTFCFKFSPVGGSPCGCRASSVA